MLSTLHEREAQPAKTRYSQGLISIPRCSGPGDSAETGSSPPLHTLLFPLLPVSGRKAITMSKN